MRPRTAYTFACALFVLLVLLLCGLSARGGELPEPPIYTPNPANTPLQNLVTWKIQWLRERIKARKSSIAGKENALKSDPDIDKDEAKKEIDALKKENEREDDEIKGLQAPNAFDPTVPGTNLNVKLVRDNVKAAIARFQALAITESRISHDEKKSKKERDEAEAKSKDYSSSGGKLGGDLDEANKGDLKGFPE
ncbi:MAG: hypothetical protein ACLQMT_14135 [Candidatus Acidiferrales bacterium]